MKNVVISLSPPEQVVVEYVNEEKYYGIIARNGKEKGFIARERFDCGNFMPRCLDSMTNGNQWEGYYTCTLVGTIRKLIVGGYRVVEFNTAEELFKWIITKD